MIPHRFTGKLISLVSHLKQNYWPETNNSNRMGDYILTHWHKLSLQILIDSTLSRHFHLFKSKHTIHWNTFMSTLILVSTLLTQLYLKIKKLMCQFDGRKVVQNWSCQKCVIYDVRGDETLKDGNTLQVELFYTSGDSPRKAAQFMRTFPWEWHELEAWTTNKCTGSPGAVT